MAIFAAGVGQLLARTLQAPALPAHGQRDGGVPQVEVVLAANSYAHPMGRQQVHRVHLVDLAVAPDGGCHAVPSSPVVGCLVAAVGDVPDAAEARAEGANGGRDAVRRTGSVRLTKGTERSSKG